jgi:hypothetical protein
VLLESSFRRDCLVTLDPDHSVPRGMGHLRLGRVVRDGGLAAVGGIGVLGILAAFEALSCALAPVQIIAGILMILAWLVSAKEVLDLEWLQTVATVVLGWLAQFAIATVITGLLFGQIWPVATALGGLLGSQQCLGGLGVGPARLHPALPDLLRCCDCRYASVVCRRGLWRSICTEAWAIGSTRRVSGRTTANRCSYTCLSACIWHPRSPA